MAYSSKKARPNGMAIINEHIKENKFSNVYVLTGDERYLVLQYRDKLTDALIDRNDTMNFSLFRDDSIVEDEIVSIADTMPFFADRRVIVIEGGSFLNKKNSDKIFELIQNLSESSVIIFVESQIDGRNKLFTLVSKKGTVAYFDTPDNQTLIKWVKGLFSQDNIAIEDAAIYKLLENTGNDMSRIATEVEKIKCYGLDKERISLADVESLSTDAVEDKIFEMIDEITKKNKARTLKLYDDLKYLKTDAMSILALITNQYNRLLKTSEVLVRGNDVKQVTSILKIQDWIAKKYIAISKNYTTRQLLECVNLCVDTDNAIKTGRMKKDLAVEMLILRLLG